MPRDDGLQVDEHEVLAACLPDPGKLSDLNLAAARKASGGRAGARDKRASWLSEKVKNRDFKGFAAGITKRLMSSDCDLEAEGRLKGVNPETEAAFFEFAGVALMNGVDFSAVNPEGVAGKFLTAVKKKMVKDGAEGFFKRLGQARPESHAQDAVNAITAACTHALPFSQAHSLLHS